jgi:2-polyprenyl-3-methyl-5-hydroxy-6-metoxy-1,4-benzoquinol methylase
MYVPRDVSVLDIGCGFGETLGYHRNRGCSAHGTEMDRNAQRIAESQGLDIRPGQFDASEWTANFFDYVTMDQVIEHMADPVPLLCDLQRVMKPNAKLIFTTPNAGSLLARCLGRRWIHWHPPYHVVLYSRKSVKILLAKSGYEVESITTVTQIDWSVLQYMHCALKLHEGERTPVWDPLATRALYLSERISSA